MARFSKRNDESYFEEEIFINQNNVKENIHSNVNMNFIRSVESFSSKDIVKTGAKTAINRRIGFSLFARAFAFFLCISVFAYSVYSIVVTEAEKQRAADNYSNLQNLFGTGIKSEVLKPSAIYNSIPSVDLLTVLGSGSAGIQYNPPVLNEELSALASKLEMLKNQNSDTYGWIRIDGTAINYPIMKGEDNEFYLEHDFDKQSSKSGSIFADFRVSDVHSANRNTVIYGHCMSNGTMFRSVKDFFHSSNRETLAKTMKIEIITPEGVFNYEVFSTYRSEGASFVKTSFSSNVSYLEFLNTIYAKSVLKKKVNFDENSKIITLSTCTNVVSKPNERYVLHCIMTGFTSF